MNKAILYFFFSVVSLIFYTKSYSQSPSYSETLIKYDLATHKTDKPIPFDHSFTLIVEKLSKKGIDNVEAFEAKFKNGKRIHVANNFEDCDGKRVSKIVKDMDLRINPYSDTIQIFFPPLKPNVNFDVLVVYYLQTQSRNLLLNVNSMISAGESNADGEFIKFYNSTIDDLFNLSSCAITNFTDYNRFYSSNLASIYAEVKNDTKYLADGFLTENDVKAIDIATSLAVSDFRDGSKLLEVSKRNLWVAMQKGLIDINKVWLPNAEGITKDDYGHIRLKNLESNIAFIDSIFQRVDRVISKGKATTRVGAVNIINDDLRSAIEKLKDNLKTNFSYLDKRMTSINAAIDEDERLRQGSYLAGNTLSSDLKTAGGNILFLDAGLSHIVARDVKGNATYIPKLYWGVSIYFRSIDKNTRRNRFPKKFDPTKYDGCHEEILERNPDGSVKQSKILYGPDYGIATRSTIWQHLALNVGITFGSTSNKEFDNFYNGTSLLVGPAFRFARGFKWSFGTALLRRDSKNPVVSEKKVIMGLYASLSVDIDLIQGIKDVTTILFK